MSLAAGLYAVAASLAAPWLRFLLGKRVKRGKEIPARVAERYGITSLPRPPGRLVWIHAASIGETLSVLPVMAALAGQCEVLLTTGTVTSARLAAAQLPAHARHQFVPLDVPAWVEKFLAHWRPDCAVFLESELWPVTIGKIDGHGIPRLLLNARMSARSAARWRLLPKLAGTLIFGFRWLHVQSAADAVNFQSLGAAGILPWGNLKFAAPPLPVDEAELAAWRLAIAGPLWLAASTHSGEEAIIFAAHEKLLDKFPGLMTIIMPRHPERGAQFTASRRSLGQKPRIGEVYIADTVGELGLFYRLAPFAFIGGSLVAHGGQNVIEPARLGRPVLVGPHTQNFAEPVATLAQAGALRVVHDAPSLAEAVAEWLSNPPAAQAAGDNAANAFASFAELPAKLAKLILETSL